MKKLQKQIQLDPSFRELNKKFFLRSMTVKQGDRFEVPNTYMEYLNRQPGDYIRENIIKEDETIDEITFYYADFIALQIMGTISLRNLEHLKFIPEDIED